MRRAAALPMVLFTLAIAGALTVGGAFVSRQIAVSARVLQRGSRLASVPERLVVQALAGWDSVARHVQPVGSTSALVQGGPDRLWVTRLSTHAYWLVSESRDVGKPNIFRRLGAVVALDSLARPRVPHRGWIELPR